MAKSKDKKGKAKHLKKFQKKILFHTILSIKTKVIISSKEEFIKS